MVQALTRIVVSLPAVVTCRDRPLPLTVQFIGYTGPFMPGVAGPDTSHRCTSKSRYPGPVRSTMHWPPSAGGGATGGGTKLSAPVSETLFAEGPPHISPCEPIQGELQALGGKGKGACVPAVLPQKQ